MKNARNQHRTDYAKELIKIVQTTKDREELKKKIAAYHERDIANAIVESDKTVRKCIYDILDIADIAEIFSYIEEEPGKYLEEMPIEQAAKVVSNMDSDDAMDLFEELNEEDKYKLLKRLDKGAKEDVQKLLSYEEDQIGSCMTNNYIVVKNDVTIREAMSTLVKQAGEHDNIQTLYVIDENGIFAGAIDLKDLIIAREHDKLQDIISSSSGSVETKLKTLKEAVSYLSSNRSVFRNTFEEVQQNALEMGVKVTLDGNIPSDMQTENLIAVAVRECVTNCIRHAKGNRVDVSIHEMSGIIRVVITNNGEVPKEKPKEGSGLSSLRRSVESSGGEMYISHIPAFALILNIPGKELYEL